MPGLPKISDSEWLVMTRLWEKYPQTATEIAETELDGKTLDSATARTLLRRLIAKKAVGYTVDENNLSIYHYHPLVCEKDCIRKENKRFFELYYRNNTSKLISGFFDDVEMSDDEIERLKKMLDAKKKGSQAP
jgi:BlaI family penicillinase repressor